MLIIHKAIIRLRICVDLVKLFYIQLVSRVLGDVLVQSIDDLLFQNDGPPILLSRES